MKHALRRVLQRPAVFLTAVATLTFGIGIGTVLFNWVNFLLLRPLPVDRPNEVVSVEFRRIPNVSFPNYIDVRDRNQVFTGVAAMRVAPMNMSQDAGNARIWGYLVTGNYFDLLAINAARGRLLTPADDIQAGGHPVAVISYGAWERRFGGDPGVIGKTIQLNKHTFTIVGVAPPGFVGTEVYLAAEIWIPFSMIREIEGRDWRDARVTRNAWAVARLKPEISRPQAAASLRLLADDMAREYPEVNEGLEIGITTPGLLANGVRGPVTGVAVMLMALAGLTLLVACANLSGLMLAQGADRRRDMAIRVAMGARRSALLRMVAADVLIIGATGGVFGLILSKWFARFLMTWLPAMDFPIHLDLSTDWRVFAFAAACSLLSALLFGLLPALRMSAVDITPALKNESGLQTFRRFHLRDAYVAVQVSIAVVLLSSSVTMAQTIRRTSTMDLGVESAGAAVVRFDQGLQGYTPEQGRELHRRLLARVRNLPGIQSASISNSIPFSIDQSSTSVYIEDAPVPKASDVPRAAVYETEPGIFRALGTRLVAGRDFSEQDQANTPSVAVVNQIFVDQLLAGGSALGKRFRNGATGDPIEIVGVVEAGKYQHLYEAPLPAIWRPMAQRYNTTSTLVARTDMPEGAAIAALKAALAELDPAMPVFDAQSLQRFLDLPLSPLRFSSLSLNTMSALAIFLCALGLYGLLAYSTAQRGREIGIRIALGASRWDVLRALTFRTALLVGVSAGIGLILAIGVSRLLAPVLLSPPDLSSYGIAVTAVVLIAAFACLLPARRALQIEPSSALRCE